MNTNRDFYKHIAGLIKEKQDKAMPPLEIYLSALMRRAGKFASNESLTLSEFFSILRDAFEGPGDAVHVDANAGYLKWKSEVGRQIVDLQQMDQNGQLKDEQRYFGISAPSGRYWYNFDPCTYIECGTTGALGGWAEGDETGRSYVPGPVAFVASDGSLTSADPRDLDLEPVEIFQVTWEMISEFSWCGQNYE